MRKRPSQNEGVVGIHFDPCVIEGQYPYRRAITEYSARFCMQTSLMPHVALGLKEFT